MFSRLAVCTALLAFSALVVVQRPEPIAAQTKEAKKDLEKQIADLKQSIAAGDKTVTSLKQEVTTLQAANKKALSDNANGNAALKTLQTTMDSIKGAGLIHVVILKVKSDSPSTETQSLIDDANSQLSKIKTVRSMWVGKPVTGSTSAVNSDYTVALVVMFDDATGLKTYANDSAHTKFVDKHMKLWETPTVYDIDTSRPPAP
jgi:biopolymer transport protein ExbD